MPILPQASSAAAGVDSVFLFILALSVVFLICITFLMLYFVVRYGRRRHPKGEDIEGNTWLEIAWTVTPAVLFLVMFFYGWTNFSYMRSVPRDAMVIDVTARQWAWSFTYPNGKRTAELYVALDKPVKLQLHSLDVIHGFFVPALRVKEDVVPGKENYTWFMPTRLGAFDIECTVICGVNHANMLSKVVVVPVSEFEVWYFGDESAAAPGGGRALASAGAAENPAVAILTRESCLSCHSLDGSVQVGPTLKGLYGKRETVVTDGTEQEITVDESYLTMAIREPMSQIVKGYQPVMPPNTLKDEEVNQVIGFIKELQQH